MPMIDRFLLLLITFPPTLCPVVWAGDTGPDPCALSEGPHWRPCSKTANLSDRLVGEPDERGSEYGRQGAARHTMKFSPPDGMRTRVLRIHGDFLCGVVNPPPNGFAGSSGCFTRVTTDASRSAATRSSDGILLERRVLAGQRAAFGEDIVNGIAAANALRVTQGVFANTTGRLLLLETTLQVVYRFEPIPGHDEPPPAN